LSFSIEIAFVIYSIRSFWTSLVVTDMPRTMIRRFAQFLPCFVFSICLFFIIIKNVFSRPIRDTSFFIVVALLFLLFRPIPTLTVYSVPALPTAPPQLPPPPHFAQTTTNAPAPP
jgi:hypothetical protein